MSDNNQYVTKAELAETLAAMEATLLAAIAKSSAQKTEEKPVQEDGILSKTLKGAKNNYGKILFGSAAVAVLYWFFGRADSQESGGTIDFRKQQMNKMTGVSGNSRSAA